MQNNGDIYHSFGKGKKLSERTRKTEKMGKAKGGRIPQSNTEIKIEVDCTLWTFSIWFGKEFQGKVKITPSDAYYPIFESCSNTKMDGKRAKLEILDI